MMLVESIAAESKSILEVVVTDTRKGLSRREGAWLTSEGGRIEVTKEVTLLSVLLFGDEEQLSTFVCERTETRGEKGGEHALANYYSHSKWLISNVVCEDLGGDW